MEGADGDDEKRYREVVGDAGDGGGQRRLDSVERRDECRPNGHRQPTQMATTSRPVTALRQQPAIDRMFDGVRPAAKAETDRRLRGRGVGRAKPRRSSRGAEANYPLSIRKAISSLRATITSGSSASYS